MRMPLTPEVGRICNRFRTFVDVHAVALTLSSSRYSAGQIYAADVASNIRISVIWVKKNLKIRISALTVLHYIRKSAYLHVGMAGKPPIRQVALRLAGLESQMSRKPGLRCLAIAIFRILLVELMFHAG